MANPAKSLDFFFFEPSRILETSRKLQGIVFQEDPQEHNLNKNILTLYMGVSKNRGGPPKWMVYDGKPY